MAKKLGTTHMTVARLWRRYGLQPHRLRHHMVSDDPHFEEKAADIIGLYLHPPAHAAVFCVDEKSAIQALDRLDPVLPLSPAAPSPTASSTFGTARSRSTRPWKPRAEKSWQDGGAPHQRRVRRFLEQIVAS